MYYQEIYLQSMSKGGALRQLLNEFFYSFEF